jgi:tryptophan synthase beta subunit
MTANNAKPESYRSGPDESGHFGMFGGRFVAETLMPLILEVEQAYNQAFSQISTFLQNITSAAQARFTSLKA